MRMKPFRSNTVITTLIALVIFAAGVSANARAGLQCAAMFQSETKAPIVNDVSRSNHSEVAPETRYTFIPEHVRLTQKSSTRFFVDYVFRINDKPRLKTSEVAMDSAGVIDGNLQSGREFLNSILTSTKQGKPNGTFIFLDVNNLGWVNKNFQDKMFAGDLYIAKTVEAVKAVVGENGLVFRLGGDEFGIVIENKTPEDVQKIMKNLQREIHARAHSVFLTETKRRVTDFRAIHEKYKNGQISEVEYQAALAEFKTYTQYSQEGVSMGAAYIDGGAPSAIQNKAEKMAVEMKIKIKNAFNLDTAKYTGGVNTYNPDARVQTAFRPGIPLIMSQADFNQAFPQAFKPDTARIKDRQVWFSTTPMVTSRREKEVFRFGTMGIAKYKNELKADEYRVEHYNINGNRTRETNPIEVNTVTGFMDARSQGAKMVINHFLKKADNPEAEGGTIWVSLLNLGKLNYFHRKTETGDMALGLAAKAIQAELTSNQIPFKYMGSDFYILTAGMTKQQIAEYKKVLEEKLNSSALVDKIFLEEIMYIERTEKDPAVRDKKIQEVQKLMSVKFKVF